MNLWDYLKDVGKHAVKDINTVQAIITILVPVTALGLYFAGRFKLFGALENTLTQWLGLLIIIIFAFLAPFRAWKEKVIAIKNYERTNADGFHLIFSEQENIDIKKLMPKEADRWLFTLGLVNTSQDSSIRNASVIIESIECSNCELLSLDESLVYNVDQSATTDISPKAIAKFRVFSCRRDVELPRFIISPKGPNLKEGTNIKLDTGSHRLKIIAQAEDKQPIRGEFQLDIELGKPPKLKKIEN